MAKDIEKLQEIAEEFKAYYYHIDDEYADEDDEDEDYTYDEEEENPLPKTEYDFTGIESIQQLIDKHADYFKLNNPLEAVDVLYKFSHHFDNDSYSNHFIKKAVNERIFSILMSNPTQEILNKLEKTELSEENEFKVAKFNHDPTNKAIETLIKPLIHKISNSYHSEDKAKNADELLQKAKNPEIFLEYIKGVKEADIRQYLLIGLAKNENLSQELIDDILKEAETNKTVEQMSENEAYIRYRFLSNILSQPNFPQENFDKFFSECVESADKAPNYEFDSVHDEVLYEIASSHPTIQGAYAITTKADNYDYNLNEDYFQVTHSDAVDLFFKCKPNQKQINQYIVDAPDSEILESILEHVTTKTTINKIISEVKNYDFGSCVSLMSKVLEKDNSPARITEIMKKISKREDVCVDRHLVELMEKILETDHSPEMITNVLNIVQKNESVLENFAKNSAKHLFKQILDYDSSPETIKLVEKIAQDKEVDISDHRLIIEPKVIAMIDKVNTAIESNDEKTLQEFRKTLKQLGDKQVYRIDHAAMEYLVNNFTEENLKKVNNLRAFWGLKSVISEESLTEKNLRDIRRLEFSQKIGVTARSNPHYEHTYSKDYQKFVPDYNAKYEPDDYKEVLKKNNAVKQLEEHGFDTFVEQLPRVLAKAHVPPELVYTNDEHQLLVKDFEHLLVEHYHLDQTKLNSMQLAKIEHRADPVRETFWKEIANDKKLVEHITKYLEKHGVPDYEIDQMWRDAKDYGWPNLSTGRQTIRPVFMQVHHRIALKDGGTNTPDNFVIVVRIPNWNDWSIAELDSHSPLHEYDNPLIHLYKHKEVGNDGIIISQKPKSKDDVEIRLNTVFVADEENIRNNKPERVLFYGSIDPEDMYVGKVNSHVRAVINKLNKLYTKVRKPKTDDKSANNSTTQNKYSAPVIFDTDLLNGKPRRVARKARKAGETYGE